MQGVLPPPAILYGAPLDTRKYWNYFWKNRRVFLRNLVLKPWQARKFNRAVSRWKKIKPETILFVAANGWLVLPADLVDHYLGKIKKQAGCEVALISRLSDEELKELYEEYGLSWNIRNRFVNGNNTYAEEIMRFTLHFKAWLHCVKSREPALIAECGIATPVSMPEIRFKHMAILSIQDRNKQVPLNSIPKEQLFLFPGIYSPYCYVLTPDAAEMLITAARQELLPTTGEFMAKMIKKLDTVYYPLLPQEFDDRILSEISKKAHVSLQESFWRNAGKPESLTSSIR